MKQKGGILEFGVILFWVIVVAILVVGALDAPLPYSCQIAGVQGC